MSKPKPRAIEWGEFWLHCRDYVNPTMCKYDRDQPCGKARYCPEWAKLPVLLGEHETNATHEQEEEGEHE